MGIVIRQSIKATVANYVAVVLGYLNLGYFFPKLFSTEQIGLISFILGTSTLLISFFQLGSPSAIIKFYPEVKEKNQEKDFLKFTLFIPLLLFIVLFSILALISPYIFNQFYSESPLIKEYFILIPILSLCMGFSGIFTAHCNSLLRIVIPTIIEKFLTRLLVFIMILLVLFYSLDFNSFTYGYVIIYAVCLILTVVYFFVIKPKNSHSKALKISSKFKKNATKFGAISFLTIVGGRIVENIDIIMISSMIDLSSAGIYKIAFYIGGVIMIPLSTIGQISSPLFAQFWNKKQYHKINQLYKKASINLILIGGILFTGILINLDNIFEVMPNGETYKKDGFWIILIIAGGKMINMGMSLNGHLLQNSKYYYINTYSILILGALTIITNYIFIPMEGPFGGIIGAAIASSLSLVLFNLFKFGFILVKFKMSPFSSKTIPATIILISLFFLNLLIPKLSNVFLDIFIRSSVISILFLLTTYFLHISADANKLIEVYLKKIIPWKKQP